MNYPVFIEDGYNIDGYIEPMEGLHGAVRFVFRPATITETNSWTQKEKSLPEDKKLEYAATRIVSKLVSWDILNSKSEAVPITPENVLRLNPLVYNRLLAIISGYGRSDVDPDADDNPDPNDTLKN